MIERTQGRQRKRRHVVWETKGEAWGWDQKLIGDRWKQGPVAQRRRSARGREQLWLLCLMRGQREVLRLWAYVEGSWGEI